MYVYIYIYTNIYVYIYIYIYIHISMNISTIIYHCYITQGLKMSKSLKNFITIRQAERAAGCYHSYTSY